MTKVGCVQIQIAECDKKTLERVQYAYKFDSLEQTISVLLDYSVGDSQGLESFCAYIKKQFPSKFLV
jgi:hypothetical protein